MVTALLLAFLVQYGVRDDATQLRQLLGTSYGTVIQALDQRNQILLRNTERLAPAQAADMRARMKAPDTLSPDHPVVSAKVDNVGQGLITFLFDDDFITEQVNFFFCPATPDRPERVVAIQVLLDDSRALQPAVQMLQSTYQFPPPIVPEPNYKLSLMYPVRPNLPLTIWNIGNVEALYQPISGEPLITGQLWLADKTLANQCMAIPRLSD